MAAELIPQGVDITQRTFVVNDSNGDPIAVASMNDYAINVYQVVNGRKVHRQSYTKNGTGENDTQVVDSTTIGFIVTRNHTRAMLPGLLYAEIRVQLTAASDYISSLQNNGAVGYEVAEIVESSSGAVI